MATHSNPLSNDQGALIKAPAADERRSEPRFGAEGEVTVLIREGGRDLEMLAKLVDFSLHGLRVQMPLEIGEGTEVHVFFSWGVVTTQVMHSVATESGFEVGLQLF